MTNQTRPITNEDKWSAIRGLGLYGKTARQLDAIIALHDATRLSARRENGAIVLCSPYQPFASRVIAQAAREVKATTRSL